MTALRKQLEVIKRTGRPLLGCLPLYPPLELFHSMGLAPVVLWGLRDVMGPLRESDRHVQNYACSVARHLVEFVLSDEGGLLDGLYQYNACDTLRNLPEILECGLRDRGRSGTRLFKMHVPLIDPDSAGGSSGYLRGGIDTLVRGLEAAFGSSFSPERFRSSVGLYREMRELSLKAGAASAAGLISYAEYQEKAAAWCFSTVEDQIASLRSLLSGANPALAALPARGVVLSGILPPPLPVVRAIEGAGLAVVGDDIALLYRSFAHTPAAADDPAEFYADFYRGHFPCSTTLHLSGRRPAAVAELVGRSGARGFIFIGEKFCEYEYFDIPLLEELLAERGVRTLAIEMSIDGDSIGQVRTRVEAFADMLD